MLWQFPCCYKCLMREEHQPASCFCRWLCSGKAASTPVEISSMSLRNSIKDTILGFGVQPHFPEHFFIPPHMFFPMEHPTPFWPCSTFQAQQTSPAMWMCHMGRVPFVHKMSTDFTILILTKLCYDNFTSSLSTKWWGHSFPIAWLSLIQAFITFNMTSHRLAPLIYCHVQ